LGRRDAARSRRGCDRCAIAFGRCAIACLMKICDSVRALGANGMVQG
jgi:hypothetical protein